MKFFEAIEKYQGWRSFSVKTPTLKSHYYDLRMFCLFMRNPDLETVTLEEVIDYLKMLKQLEWENNALTSKVIALKKFFKFYKDQGQKVLNYDLIPKVPYEHKLAKVMDEETHKKLLKQLKTNYPDDLRNRLLLMMLWDTGARNGELCSLNIEDCNVEQKKALIRTEKNKGSRPFREIMWTEETNKVLKRWLETREKTGPLFITLAYSHKNTRLSVPAVDYVLRKLCDLAKVPRINPHSYRHHMAHDILNKGHSIVHVAKILGHTSPNSSFAYLHLNDREMHETYRKVKGD